MTIMPLHQLSQQDQWFRYWMPYAFEPLAHSTWKHVLLPLIEIISRLVSRLKIMLITIITFHKLWFLTLILRNSMVSGIRRYRIFIFTMTPRPVERIIFRDSTSCFRGLFALSPWLTSPSDFIGVPVTRLRVTGGL